MVDVLNFKIKKLKYRFKMNLYQKTNIHFIHLLLILKKVQIIIIAVIDEFSWYTFEKNVSNTGNASLQCHKSNAFCSILCIFFATDKFKNYSL